ncbi:50S ribosomal protein L31e [Nanoarchaeota archaeon]
MTEEKIETKPEEKKVEEKKPEEKKVEEEKPKVGTPKPSTRPVLVPKADRIEREYIIPVRKKVKVVPRYKRANKAIKTVKEFLARHMKVRDRDLNKIKLDKYLNQYIWMRGIRNPPMKIKVKAVKEGDIVRAELIDLPDKFKFEKLREEKIEKAAAEAIQKKKTLMEKAKEAAKGTAPAAKPSEQTEEEKAEEKEKAKAGAEATAQMEKAAAKQAKHSAGGKTKEPKRQQRKALAK